MDDQGTNLFQRFLNKKVIFGLLGLIIAVEILWAARMVMTSKSPSADITANPMILVPTIVSLATSTTQVKVGQDLTVNINMSTDKAADGTDLIIIYDPAVLTLQNSAKPVVVGTLFSDYPANSADSKAGRITVAGISSATAGVTPNGLFGTINFKVKSVGPGTTKVALDFTPGSSTDSNVTQTGSGVDILEKVENLEIKILP